MSPPTPCPECLSPSEWDRVVTDRCICTNPRCSLVFEPRPPAVLTPRRDLE